MRIKNRKRIGPVPIVAVAVFALAALLSAGLLVLIPGSTQAQSVTGRIADVTLDVGDSQSGNGAIETVSVAADVDNNILAVPRAFPVGAQTFTISSDQDDPDDDVDQTDDADTNGEIETTSSGSDRPSGTISINETTGAITIPTDIASQENAMQADNTARITVRAEDTEGNDLPPIRFDVTIVQDPFEASGEPVTNPTNWADAAPTSCAVATLDGSALTSRGENLNATLVLVDGGDCTSAADSVEVTLQNNNPIRSDTNTYTYLVYVSGGSSFSKVDGFTGKSGLDQELHAVQGQDALGDPGEAIITVTRSMADKNNRVYLYGYLGTPSAKLSAERLKANSEAFSDETLDFVVRVQFVEGPALAFDADRDDKEFEAADGTDGDVNGSTLIAMAEAVEGGQDQDKDGYFDGMYMIGSTDVPIMIDAAIMDGNGNPLNAGDKDSRVDFSVAYVVGSDISDSAADYNSRKVMDKGTNTATINVEGWNASNKAVRVTVSATYTSPSAPDGFDLGTVTLIRVAEFASSADFSTYICKDAKDTEKAAEKGCMDGYEAKEDMRVGREDYFVVHGQFEDALGSKTQDRPELDLSDDAEEAFDPSVTSATGYSARASDGSVLVQVKEEAEFGEYTITVTNGESGDNEVTQDLTFFVAGPIDSYMVEGPENEVIELDSSAMFTVTAMDENGGVPDFGTTTATDNLVEVAVQPVTTLVTGLEPDGQLKLDEDTGMGTFIVYSALNASHGDRGRVIIGSGAMQQIVNISFGENRAPMAGMAIADQMVDVGRMVTVQSNFSDLDGDMLSYTAMSDMMDVATASVDDMGMVTITGVAMGTATITVTATDMDGAYAMQTIMVTVEAADTDTSLQDIPDSSISVTNNANSSITVNWMGGDNADRFIVVVAEPSSDPFTYQSVEVDGDAAKMTTISELSSGSSYIIIVIALQGTNFEYGVSQPVTAN